jgi:diguanylate cyclase
MALIDDNRQMQAKLTDLSGQLEESRSRIGQLQSSLARAEEIGHRDSVTGVGNRRFFDITLAGEIALARANGHELCVALGDLDNFKRVNDSFGHLVGDKVLRLFADLLVKSVKGQDKVARFGGEEFALIFPNTRLEDAAKIVDRIRGSLESKRWVVESSGQRIGAVTVSFGVARLSANNTAADLLRRVDAKLYEAKGAGRNRVIVDEANVVTGSFAAPAARAMAKG